MWRCSLPPRPRPRSTGVSGGEVGTCASALTDRARRECDEQQDTRTHPGGPRAAVAPWDRVTWGPRCHAGTRGRRSSPRTVRGPGPSRRGRQQAAAHVEGRPAQELASDLRKPQGHRSPEETSLFQTERVQRNGPAEHHGPWRGRKGGPCRACGASGSRGAHVREPSSVTPADKVIGP